jgi:hypothetical protein
VDTGTVAITVLVLVGCGRVGYDPLSEVADGFEPRDGAPDADGASPPDGALPADAGAPLDATPVDGGGALGWPEGSFGTLRAVTAVNTDFPESDPTVTADLLEMYFRSDRGVANDDIYRSRRASPSDPWGPAERVAELSSLDDDQTPEVAPDGLTIWLASTRAGGRPQQDIYIATRASRSDPWGAPTLVAELSTDLDEAAPTPSADGLRLTMHRLDGGSFDIMEATRSSVGAPFGVPRFVAELNSAAQDGAAFLWGDGRTVVFDSSRSGAGSWDLWIATRPTLADPFGSASPIAELDTADKEAGPWVSPDGRYIVFGRGQEGLGTNGDIWEAFR